MIKLNGRIIPKRLFGDIRIDYGPFNGTLQSKTVEPSPEDQSVVADEGFNALSLVLVKGATLQEKTVRPSSQEQTVVPDVGVYGLSKVIVKSQGEHGLLETVTVSPKQEEQVITPSDDYYGIDVVNVEAAPLEEVTIYPSYEEQRITPSEGYYGIGSILVEAMPDIDDPGGGGGEGDDTDVGEAEDTTFGDEYSEEEMPTGNYDYSSGTDENPSYIPEIPGGEYQALFCKKLKAGQTFRYTFDGESYDVESRSDVILYAASGSCMEDEGNTRIDVFRIMAFSGTESASYRSKKTGESNWSKYYQTQATNYGFYGVVRWQINTRRIEWGSDLSTDITYNMTGVPYHNVGMCANRDSIIAALYSCVTTVGDSGKDQFIAFGSATQILYDGSSINNVDNSPMTIYECDAADANTWVEVGSTDGNDYPVGGYTLVWNSHDMLDLSGESVTFAASDDPIAETKNTMVGKPVERDALYTVAGDTLNSLVGMAQKVTGSQEPMTPDQAANALEEFYAQPTAEELKF